MNYNITCSGIVVTIVIFIHPTLIGNDIKLDYFLTLLPPTVPKIQFDTDITLLFPHIKSPSRRLKGAAIFHE